MCMSQSFGKARVCVLALKPVAGMLSSQQGQDESQDMRHHLHWVRARVRSRSMWSEVGIMTLPHLSAAMLACFITRTSMVGMVFVVSPGLRRYK